MKRRPLVIMLMTLLGARPLRSFLISSRKLAFTQRWSTTTDWRQHPDLNPTVEFTTWKVPVQNRTIPFLLDHRDTQNYLATQSETVKHLRQRFKLVREIEDDQEHKLLFLNPETTPALHDLPSELRAELQRRNVQEGPPQPVQFSYSDFTASYVLQKILPFPPPTAFETIGHIAHLNLKEQYLPFKHTIGEVLMECLPRIETVITKKGEVTGPFRTYDFEVLAGRNETEVNMVESGVKLRFDVSEVYWCSRLSEERQRLLRDEVKPNQTIADPFSGVGAFCLMAASNMNCTIWANDWNPNAIKYLKANAKQNNVEEKFTRVSCGDAYDFLIDLGLKDGVSELPDHVVMNYPLEAPSFLGALRWWTSDGKTIPRIHVYTFAKADGERSAEDVAIDLIAENILPLSATKRRSELNEEYGCNIEIHNVRDVAPGKIVYCVSFSATRKLLRVMQGDF